MIKKKSAEKKQVNHKKGAATPVTEKRIYFKQSDFPLVTLQQAQRIASAIIDNFGGESGSPPDVALSLDISPTSSAWQSLTGAAIAYGLTDGGKDADFIKLKSLGRKLVAPEEEGEDLAARREAILKPRILKEFFERYRRAKFPGDTIGINVLKSLGIPGERAESALNIVKENGLYAGIIRETRTGPFVNLDSPGVPAPTATPDIADQEPWPEAVSTQPAENQSPASQAPSPAASLVISNPASYEGKINRVFISHGKQKGHRQSDQGAFRIRQF